ncbi:SDR family oxidoreductase [Streptomyces sp. SID13031]|uniref:SDR family oxidoreductase n=1 Tax=Streptomyces sp. SID13031 TaxID=2706046 RepID=UPI0013C980CA|nr:SDR family oxidoreductase [Streptomyces sp. SID13031]NEA32586.1 SDR family oxidoreductase [Streptomyces sp. SID13031]
MQLELSGKTAIVTGASRGIGLATVRALRAEGVQVVGAARKPTPELEETGAIAVPVDLGTRAGAQFLIDEAVRAFGGADLLVNNLGGGDLLTLAGFADLDDDAWADAFEINLFATVRVTRAALPWLVRDGGAVVNVSSIGAWRPEGPPLAYNVAKAALKAFGRGLATELGPSGVRVVTVSPGPTRTSMWEGDSGLGAQLAAAVGAPQEAIVAGAPEQVGMVTGRLAEPAEVADLISYLLSPRAASITGSDHLIDGGAIRG